MVPTHPLPPQLLAHLGIEEEDPEQLLLSVQGFTLPASGDVALLHDGDHLLLAARSSKPVGCGMRLTMMTDAAWVGCICLYAPWA